MSECEWRHLVAKFGTHCQRNNRVVNFNFSDWKFLIILSERLLMLWTLGLLCLWQRLTNFVPFLTTENHETWPSQERGGGFNPYSKKKFLSIDCNSDGEAGTQIGLPAGSCTIPPHTPLHVASSSSYLSSSHSYHSLWLSFSSLCRPAAHPLLLQRPKLQELFSIYQNLWTSHMLIWSFLNFPDFLVYAIINDHHSV